MGSYKWGYISPLIGVILLAILLLTPLVTPREPPSIP